MHHNIRGLAVIFVGIGRFAAEKDASVRVHCCLVEGYGRVEFEHYDAFGVVEEVFADAGDVPYYWNIQGGELFAGTYAGVEEEARGVDCACAEDGFAGGG